MMAEVANGHRGQETLAQAILATGVQSRIAITLGSGLGDALADWPVIARWPWSAFLDIAAGEVPGHRREFVLARCGAAPVLLVSGRLHHYQGVPIEAVGAYVHLLADAHIATLVLTNAAGGLNPEFRVGDLMVLNDHINLPGLVGENPLRGGPNFLDYTQIYAPHLRARAHGAAASAGIMLREGIYAMVGGPTYETPAEQRFLRALGADAVGMSTAPEALVARQRGLDVLAFSSITNVAGAESVSHTEVLAEGAQVAQRLATLLERLIPELHDAR
ncbi:MAG: purine-nucleoside phosphorylase [Thermomicrobiales bacterium]